MLKTDVDYKIRINKVVHYIEENFSKELTIQELAKVANYSKFHFNRVFKSITKESVYKYIKRVRLERANCYLWRSEMSIAEIAQKCGFSSTSNFAYNYKKHFGLSATDQRVSFLDYKDPNYIPDIKVEFEKIKLGKVIYANHIGKLDSKIFIEIKNLYEWAVARDVWTCNSQIILVVYDSLYVTKPENVRCDICLTIPEDSNIPGDCNSMIIPEYKMAITTINCSPKFEYSNRLFDELANWLLNSSYELDGFQYITFPKGIAPKEDDILQFNISTPVKPR